MMSMEVSNLLILVFETCIEPLWSAAGTNRYFQKVISNFNIETSFVDATDASNVENAIQSNTKVVASTSSIHSHG